jgi:site-specific DNA recombinase
MARREGPKAIGRTAVVEKKVVAYIRVSHASSVADGVSLERQEAELRAYAREHGLPEPIVLADRGLSGYRERRPGFQQLLKMIRAGEVSVCLVWDLARLSRSLRTTITFFEEEVPKIDRFIALKNNCDTSTPWGKAWIAILSSINQLYRDEISFRTKASLHYKRQNLQKLGGHVPYGYDVDGNGNLLPNSVEQEVIALIRRLHFEERMTFTAVSHELAKRGVPTKTGKAHWSPKVVRALALRRDHEVGTRDGTQTDPKRE